MGKIKRLILILLSTNFICCFFPKNIKNGFRKSGNCLTGFNEELDTNSKLHGFYELNYDYNSEGIVKNNFIFYSNGLVISKMDTLKMKINNSIQGVYKIYGDTVKILATYPPQSQVNPLIYTWFLILSDTSMEYLGESFNNEMDENKIQLFHNENQEKKIIYSPALLIKSHNIPDQDRLWIKRNKCFWCSDELYKRWKKGS
jgi:hypothetical protein